MRLRALIASLLALACALPAIAADDAGYRVPPPVVSQLLTAPRVPRGAPNSSPDGAWLAVQDLRSLIPIATLAEPVQKLAGLEVLPQMWVHRTSLKNAAAGLTFYKVADGAQVRAKLPNDVRLGTVRWSHGSDRVACVAFAAGGSELWIVEAATGSARRVEGVKLHSVSNFLEWSNDDKGMFVSLVPTEVAPAPEPARIPEGPSVRKGAGRATPQRTARDVLRTPDDQAGFARLVTAQLAWIPLGDGSARVDLGPPVALAGCDLSPDDNWIVVSRYTLPAPTGFPYYLFPRKVELLKVGTKAVTPLADIPLNDRSAIASVAPLGLRDFTWAPDAKSLWCLSWEDKPGASPQAAVRDTALPPPGHDRILKLEAPFTGAPAEVARAEFPVDGMVFTADGTKLLLQESYEPRRVERQGWIDVKTRKRTTLVFRSTEGAYDNPGKVAFKADRHGTVVWVTPDGKAFYRFGEGFRADGQRPFLDRCPFDGGKPTRVFESEAARLEAPVTLLAADGRRFLTLAQSATEPPNWFLRRAGDAKGQAVSAFTNPAEALSRAPRQQFQFKRDDGVTLNAEVILPPDWKPEQGPLPTIFWIYPNDYRSAAAASQNRTSANRFPSQSALNPEVLVTQGYAVVRPDLAIVGTNDQYVSELQRSASAAVDECVRRGFTDRARIGIGGHSYGAFSTVNCLAHTRLFKAGLASDGAYNRTLTPFTFQMETRNLWEARDTYLQMSPFLYAQQIEAPLLLAHNLDDTNVGTHPMQSQRLFEALNGLGKTVQLVEYPYEDHGPAARETVLDYWARALEWFDRHVKKASTPTAATPQAP
jgi:dipeptidyl aminopeptidase/acylaminoacyl peptidase